MRRIFGAVVVLSIVLAVSTTASATGALPPTPVTTINDPGGSGASVATCSSGEHGFLPYVTEVKRKKADGTLAGDVDLGVQANVTQQAQVFDTCGSAMAQSVGLAVTNTWAIEILIRDYPTGSQIESYGYGPTQQYPATQTPVSVTPGQNVMIRVHKISPTANCSLSPTYKAGYSTNGGTTWTGYETYCGGVGSSGHGYVEASAYGDTTVNDSASNLMWMNSSNVWNSWPGTSCEHTTRADVGGTAYEHKTATSVTTNYVSVGAC